MLGSTAPMAIHAGLPYPIRKLLLEADLELEAPFTARIFTNRDLAFERIPVIGFDMDYTLALYRQAALETLSLECTVEKLLRRGYPARLGEIGSDLRRERTPVGSVVNLASRLGSRAGAEEILISDPARRAIGDDLQVSASEAVALKGFNEPQTAHFVIGLRPTSEAASQPPDSARPAS